MSAAWGDDVLAGPVPSRERLLVLLRRVDLAAREYAARCQQSSTAYWRHGCSSVEDREASERARLARVALQKAVDDLGQQIGRLR